MPNSYNTIFLLIVALTCVLGIQAQTRVAYKDVLLNGKPAKLNLATGEFIFIDSKGNDSIVKANRPDEDYSIERLNYHIVEPGETMLMIAEQYGLSLNEIKVANQLKTTLVSVGQKLRVRNFEAEDAAKLDAIWVVEKGHSLYHISRKTGVSITTLKRLNGLTNNNLAIGQKLYLK